MRFSLVVFVMLSVEFSVLLDRYDLWFAHSDLFRFRSFCFVWFSWTGLKVLTCHVPVNISECLLIKFQQAFWKFLVTITMTTKTCPNDSIYI